jgi:hypothetical protein
MRFRALLGRARIDQERSSRAGVPDPSGIETTRVNGRGAPQARLSRDGSSAEREHATDAVKLHLREIGCSEAVWRDSDRT